MKKSNIIATSLLAIALLVANQKTSSAQILYGIGGTDTGTGPNAAAYTLFNFNSTTPGVINAIGTVTATAGYTLQSIAFQPGTGQLFGLQYNASTLQAQLVRISIANAVLTTVGNAFNIGSIAGSAGNSAAISFNPSSGGVRLVTGTFGNYRINASTGALSGQDPSVAYAGGDPNANNTLQISSLSYNPGATLYDIDYINNSLATQNLTTGALTTVGFLGITATQGASSEGFTIGSTGVGFLNTSNSGQAGSVQDHLYTVNLATGLASDLGLIGSSSTFNTVGLAVQVVPEPGTAVLFGGGVLLLTVAGYRRLRRA